MKAHREVRGRVLGPVEGEASDGLEGLRSQRHGDGLRRVGLDGLPFGRGGAVDGGEGELAWLEGGGGGDGEALRDVAGDGGDEADLAVREHEGAVGGKRVGRGVVVADLYGDGGVGEGLVGVGEGGAEAGYGGGGLV